MLCPACQVVGCDVDDDSRVCTRVCMSAYMQGEIESSPYYYQNLGEAEYVVALYSYMRLLGYPAEKISILTTYNGQKDLIKDVVKRRCGGHPLLGYPAKVGQGGKIYIAFQRVYTCVCKFGGLIM